MSIKRVSSKDVAKAAGVSQATVSYVLNNNQHVKIKPETRQLVIETAKKMNYHTNYIARSMRLNKAASIGIVTSKNMSNYLFMNVLEGIKNALVSKNYSLTLCFTRNEYVFESEYMRYFHSKLIDGVIFAFADISDEETAYLTENSIPYVSIHAGLGDDSPFQIKTNVECAMSAAIRHLLGKGITDIGYIGQTAGNLCAIRYKGYNSAVSKIDIPIVSSIIKLNTRDDEVERELQTVFEKRLLPRAIFCDTINVGFHMLRYARKQGISIPDELSVIAVGTSPFTKKLCPTLSCVEAPLYEMGFCGGEMLLSRLDESFCEEKDIVVMDWSFVVRESC